MNVASILGHQRVPLPLQRIGDADGCAQLIADLTAILFASPLQPSTHPSPAQVRTAVRATVQADPACFGTLAQAYGDAPDTAPGRARWCRRMVLVAYGLDERSMPGEGVR